MKLVVVIAVLLILAGCSAPLSMDTDIYIVRDFRREYHGTVIALEYPHTGNLKEGTRIFFSDGEILEVRNWVHLYANYTYIITVDYSKELGGYIITELEVKTE